MLLSRYNLMGIHWKGTLNAHQIIDDLGDSYKKQDPILEEILNELLNE